MAGPNDELRVSTKTLEMIGSFEGWSSELYEDPVGHTTIGYGHLVHRGPITQADRQGPFRRGVSKQQGLELLRSDAARFEKAVRELVTVPLNQNQFDALVSFSFNVGAGALKKSNLLKKVNARDFEGGANEFAKWVKGSGKVLPGLVRRRTAEAAMFRGSRTRHKVTTGEEMRLYQIVGEDPVWAVSAVDGRPVRFHIKSKGLCELLATAYGGVHKVNRQQEPEQAKALLALPKVGG